MGAWLLGVAIAFPAFAAAGSGNAGAQAEARSASHRLIMVDDPSCRFCRAWDEAVGRGYAKSPEGRKAPLTRVRRGAAELRGLAPVIYTPTFIVMRGGTETGRISGYPGPGYFYEELREILARGGAPDRSRAATLGAAP